MSWWDRLLGRKDEGDRKDELALRRVATSRTLDAALDRARAGLDIKDDELEACAASFSRYHDALAARYQTENNLAFPDEERASFYTEALKLAALGHPHHNAWPFIADIRRTVLPTLRRRVLDSGDPWQLFCSIIPALLDGDVAFAVRSFQQIDADLFLARLAVRWVEESIVSFPRRNHMTAAQQFLAAIPRPPTRSTARERLTPVRRWVLAASVHPSHILDSRDQLADTRGTAATRLGLASDWDITDHASAERVLSSLFHKGHRALLARDLAAPQSPSTPARGRFVARNREALLVHHILAWDLCRLIQVARSSFTAGYLLEGEAWAWLFRAARRLRETYSSWEQLGDDYILGCRYFAPDDADDSGHIDHVRWLQNAPESLWNTISWDQSLDDPSDRRPTVGVAKLSC